MCNLSYNYDDKSASKMMTRIMIMIMNGIMMRNLSKLTLTLMVMIRILITVMMIIIMIMIKLLYISYDKRSFFIALV
jgi:hypothetical protein